MPWTELSRPTLRDVLRARRVLRQYLAPTPLLRYPALDEVSGAALYLKHENHQPVGAFKVRGGIYLMSQLSPEERARGVIAASTGNHGQSVAYAARLFNVPAIVVVPEQSNPSKVEAIRALGAEVRCHGHDFMDAVACAAELAGAHGYRYIHSGDEPHLIAGVGTLTLEILEEQPEIDTIIVPVGGGSGAAAAALVAKTIDPAIELIAVQTAGAPGGFHSWQQRRRVLTQSVDTFAEGLATAGPFDLPLSMICDLIDDFVLVDDEELRAAIRLLIDKAHTLAEGAGAAALAAALRLRERLAGRKVAVVLSGGNLSLDQLRTIVKDG